MDISRKSCTPSSASSHHYCGRHDRTKTWSRTLDRMPPTVEVEPSDDSMTDGSMGSMGGDTEDRSPHGDAEPQQVGLVRARSCPAL